MLSHDQILATLEPLRDALAGRIYIDVTISLDADYSTFVLPPETSFAEYVQERFPEVQVVGAFKHTWWELLDMLGNNGMYLDVYIVGDDDTAKRELRSMCSAMPFRFRDAGRLRQARFIEHMTLLSGALGPL
jgi:predicted dinucleotide-binding enzyme